MRGILAAGVVIAVTALAGCTDDPEPRFEEPTESPTASGSTPAAADPEPWEEKSKAGAVAFARHWVDTFNQAVLTGESADLASISDRGCATCNGFMQRIREVYGAGGEYLAHDWRVVDSAVAPGGTAERRELVLRISRAPEKYRESGGAKVQTSPSSKVTFTVDLEWRDGEWTANRLVLL